LADSLGGKVTSSLQFSGTGDSIASVIASLNGEGSFTVSDLSVGGFDPDAFAVAGTTPNILDLDAEDMSKIVADALAKGTFAAPEMSGVMNLAGGALRSNNLGASAENADLFGSLAVDFNTLAVSGNWTLSPSGQVDAAGLINETTARIDSIIGGTLLAPSHTLDLVSMVDSVKVRAYELEVDRLEKLKAADEARQRAAAEERARLMAIEARRKAEAAAAELAAQRAAEREAAQRAAQQKLAEEQAAARKAAEEKAAAEKAAAEEAAAQAAAEQAAAEQAVAEQAAAEAAAEQAAQSQTSPTQVAPVAPDSSPVPGAPTDFTQPVTPPDPQALDLFLQDLEAETLNDLVPCGPSDAPVDLLGGGGVTTTPDANCVVAPAQE